MRSADYFFWPEKFFSILILPFFPTTLKSLLGVSPDGRRIARLGDIELSRDEDSVTSLAFLRHVNASRAIALAGINSSEAAQSAGTNEHLRAFAIEYDFARPPSRKTASASSTSSSASPPHASLEDKVAAALGAESSSEDDEDNREGAEEEGAKARIRPIARRSLFRADGGAAPGARRETYQRVLRLSPVYGKGRDQGGSSGGGGGVTSRLAALATGLAPEGEIVLVEASAGTEADDPVLGRIELGKGREAADVDILGTGGGGGAATDGGAASYTVAYCTDHEVSLCRVPAAAGKRWQQESGTQVLDASCVYVTPHPDVFSSSAARPVFRALRFLVPGCILLLANKAGRSGAELQVLSYEQQQQQQQSLGGQITLRQSLHRSMRAGVGLEVSSLGAPEEKNDASKQFLVAVAGQDISIELLSLQYDAASRACKFSRYATLSEVHPLQMTKICFSSVMPPATAASEKLPNTAAAAVRGEGGAHLRLASVSMGNTVVVHSIPLTPVSHKGGSSQRPRYTLTHQPSRFTSRIAALGFLWPLAVLLVSVILAILLRPLLPEKSVSLWPLNAVRYGGGDGRGAGRDNDGTSAHPYHQVTQTLNNQEGSMKTDEPRAGAGAEHDDGGDDGVDWKQKLADAGETVGEQVLEQGQQILKGVVLGEIAGGIAQAVGGG